MALLQELEFLGSLQSRSISTGARNGPSLCKHSRLSVRQPTCHLKTIFSGSSERQTLTLFDNNEKAQYTCVHIFFTHFAFRVSHLLI